MTTSVKTLGRNDKLSVADSLMRTERIRHLPVIDEDGRLAGIISQRDLFFSALMQALGYGTVSHNHTLEGIYIKEVMTDNVITTTPDTLLTAAAKAMVDNRIGCLPVVDGESLVGILSESDIVSAVVQGKL
ncbi:MAG TPA: CBS domain-containing protein [Terriglobia bacterium]|nr:CBS domain-containing protein [Terriglobia bacterium]